MLKEERRKLILEELFSKGTLSVRDLANEFSVTYETIRKDLTFLESEGLLSKSHGGATLKENAIEYPFQTRLEENSGYKQAIAKKAIELIPTNSSIIVATGSTTLELAKLLFTRSDLKIFTDSLPVANLLLKSKNQSFLFGGELREKSSSVFGGWTAGLIKQIHVDMCFLGTDGFSNLPGPTSPSSSDTYLDRIIIEQSDKAYILGDSTKFTRKSTFKICDWTDISALITNKEVTDELTDKISQQVKIIKAE